MIARHLADGGRLHVVSQPFQASQAEPTGRAISAVLERHGFGVDSVLVEDVSGATGVCVIASQRPRVA